MIRTCAKSRWGRRALFKQWPRGRSSSTTRLPRRNWRGSSPPRRENAGSNSWTRRSQEVRRAQKTVSAHFAKAVTLLGPSGSGQLTKMVNQICIAGLVQALSEGLNFAIKAGLDAKLVLDVISKGAAQSWQMENRGKTMVDDKFDFGFAVDWMRKDLRICSETAREIGAQLPVTQMVAGFYDEISKMGGGRWDTSSLIRRLRRA